MIPQNNDALKNDFVITPLPSRTYALSGNRIIGFTDGLNAVKQAIFLILHTERFWYPIYTSRYGVELAGLIGQDPDYAAAELKRRVTEALMTDDRITGVDGFEITHLKSVVSARFTVRTLFGSVTATAEVII